MEESSAAAAATTTSMGAVERDEDGYLWADTDDSTCTDDSSWDDPDPKSAYKIVETRDNDPAPRFVPNCDKDIDRHAHRMYKEWAGHNPDRAESQRGPPIPPSNWTTRLLPNGKVQVIPLQKMNDI